MKILIIFPFLSHPIDAGNKQWVMAQVEEFCKLGHEVFMLCLNIPGLKSDMLLNKKEYNQTIAYWRDHGFVYNASLWQRFKYSFYMNLRKRFCGGYYHCDDLYPQPLTKFVKQLQADYQFDACIVNYYWLTKLFEEIPFKITAINTHDVFAFKDKVVGKKNPWMCTNPNEEAKGIQRAHYAFALQDEESAYYRRIAPLTKVLNVYCPYKTFALPLTRNHNLVILASSNGLNIEGFEWFISHIYPSIIKEFPDVDLKVGGYICKKLGHCRGNGHITLVGEVDDPVDLYKLGDVAINPCMNGTGLKIKTFEALSYGRIAMTHPHSTIGIYNKDKAPVFNSTTAEDWVEFLKNVWNEKSDIREMSKRSISYIEEMNSYISEQYKKFLEV